jgi:acyl carrier protein
MNMPSRFRKTLLAHLPYADSDDLAPGDDLAALGLDSMGTVQLLIDLEENFGLELPDELITEETFATAGSLWQTVAGLIGSGLIEHSLIEPELGVDA